MVAQQTPAQPAAGDDVGPPGSALAAGPGEPAARPGSATDDLVAVLVPARNEERSIEACLASIAAQTHANLQIIVVDGDSDDATPQVLARLAAADPRIEVVPNPRRIIPTALNIGLAAARAPWLVRVDAHSTVPPDYVRQALAHLRTGKYGAVGGRKDGVAWTPAGHAIAAVLGSRFGVGGSTYHWGEAVCFVEHVPFGAYPVDLLRSMGGWDEGIPANEDFELDYRLRLAGYDLLFDPALRISWETRQGVGALFRQYRRYGAGKVLAARKHPASMRPRHVAAPALVAMLATAAAALPVSRKVAAALTVPYAVALSGATAVTAREVPRGSRRWVAPSFAAMHLGWGIGFWSQVGRLLATGGPSALRPPRPSGAAEPVPDTPDPS